MYKHETLGVYDYDRNKICDLYDSQIELLGQAYDIKVTKEINGCNTLEFSLPYIVDIESVHQDQIAAIYGLAEFGRSRYGQLVDNMQNRNFRWAFMKSDFLIRYTRGNQSIWFVASKPKKNRTNNAIYGTVTCNGFESLLKTRNIYMTFDDENGIGTIDYLLAQIVSGTGWTYNDKDHGSDTLYERDGETEKVRSLSSDGKKGAMDLITTTCNLFQARPIFDTDAMTLTIKAMKNREQVLEGVIGKNLSAISVSNDSSNIATRVYVEGEYGDYGYVGIDDVIVDGEKYGLSYIMNFDYYRQLGVFKQRHEDALATYIRDIKAKKQEIYDNGLLMISTSNDLNGLIGQCKVVVYYKADGYITPKFKYGDMTDEQMALAVGDDVVILNNDGTITYDEWENTASQMTNAYGVAKFVTPSSGAIGAKEVQIEAKKKEIEQLDRKIARTVDSVAVAQYQAKKTELQDEITLLYLGNDAPASMKNSLGQRYIPTGYSGNVDLINRIIVPASTMLAKWPDFDGTYATLYSETYSAGTTDEYDYTFPSNRIINCTPIKTDGSVLSKYEVETYLTEIIGSARTAGTTIKAKDYLHLVLSEDQIASGKKLSDAYKEADTWTIILHEYQEQWDEVRAKYNWFGEGAAMDPAKVFGDTTINTDGLYRQMHSVMKSDGLLYYMNYYDSENTRLNLEQDEIEATFIAAMGYMLRDGYWNDNNYTVGQEQYLYEGALDVTAEMSKPAVSYTFSYVRIAEDFDIPDEEIEVNAIFKLYDKELDIDDKLFIKKFTYGVDNKSLGSIDVSNQDITLTGNDLGSLISRMSQLADLIDQKNALYERAKAISNSGTIFADRLNGQINVLTTQLMSTVSNWHTDEQGNILFESADGSSAMMLCGAGFMIASSKNDDGSWNWRTFGTGSGFTADEIIAGFISAERIEAGTIAVSKLVPSAGSDLDISGNNSIVDNGAIAPEQFLTSKNYVIGQLVRYNGKIYRFKQNHSSGAWNASQVDLATVGTAISLVPGMITTQITDSLGNYYTKTETASQISTAIATNNGNYYTKTETASQISTAIANNNGNYYTKTETASQISTAISNNNGNYYTKTETASQISTAITSNNSNYYTKTETASQISTAISNNNGNYYTKTETASQISTAITTNNGNYYTKTETASQISTYVGNNAYGKVSGITINSSGIDVTGSKYVKIRSGGTFEVDSSNLVIDSEESYMAFLNKGSAGEGIAIEFGKEVINPQNIQYSQDFQTAITIRSLKMSEINDTRKMLPGALARVKGLPNTGIVLTSAYGVEQTYGGSAQPAWRNGLFPMEINGTVKEVVLGCSNFPFERVFATTYEGTNAIIDNIRYLNLTQTSSREIKHDIKKLPSVGDALDNLTPVTFIYNDDKSETKRIGLIYEDTIDVMPEICAKGEGNKAINYVELIPVLLKEIQELRRRVKDLEEM